MAQIQKVTAGVPLNPDAAGMPRANIQSATGRALQGVGQAVGGLADAFQQREEQKQNFKAENDYRRLQLEYGREMDERSQNMAPDGAGFHDDFMGSVYTPKREEFLQSLPPRLQEKYSVILGEEGADTEQWSIRAATQERDQLYSWYDSGLQESRDMLANAIAVDPEAYDELLKQGMAEIDASGLPTAKKEEHRKTWENMAQVAHLNRMLETNPEAVLRDLGADPRYLSPTTQFSSLKEALIKQESGGDPNAVSVKGAIGLMQVMPATAYDIAKEMQDPNFPTGGSPEQVHEYLSNPVVNQRYGDFYLKKQIRKYARTGGLEAALIAYNGGPGRADKWIESGFDDSVLPAETRKYYKAIMARLPGGPTANKGDPSKVQLVFKGGVSAAGEVNKDLRDRVQSSFAGLGIDRVRITSGHRDEEENKRAGGAKGSQHIHGNAVDIDVSGFSHAERNRIIRSLSANGVTGIGVGSNIIHADLGGRRAWGYKTAAGGGEVPSWAKEAVKEHLSNSARTPRGSIGTTGRYGTLPYNDRQKFIASADRVVTDRYNVNSKATAVQRVELQTAMQNDLAAITATGQSTGQVDDTAVATILGEDDYVKWARQKELANRTFTAKDGIGTMTAEEMQVRLTDYEPEPGSVTFADDQRVQAAVQKEIDRVTRERAQNPDRAAMRFPDVEAAWKEVSGTPEPTPQATQEFVRLMLDRQKEFSLKPGSEAPVPREWGVQIGRSMARIPELGGNNLDEVNALILLQYEALREVFGDYTEEVILYALSEYRGVGENTAGLITGYMEAIEAGGDPMRRLRQQEDAALDRDQVESTSEQGFFSRVRNFLAGEEPEPEEGETATVEETAVDDELVLRAIGAMDRLGELDASDEAALINRYGRDVVTAAKARSGRD